MTLKKFFIGGAVSLMIFINFPQFAGAEDVETFGSEFEDDGFTDRNANPNGTGISAPFTEVETPTLTAEDDDENFGDTLNFDTSMNNQPQANEITPPVDVTNFVNNENPTDYANNFSPTDNDTNANANDNNISAIDNVDNSFNNENNISTIDDNNSSAVNSNERIMPPSKVNQKVAEQNMKKMKPRFVKLAVDDQYTYYLDKQSISWKRIPYFANEFMVDVWVRMIERAEDNSQEDYLSRYISEESDEIALAREQGISYAPIDVEVLSHRHYFMEHYYLRPTREQIQFLCELEVVGYPQNTISERKYDYQNWEYLVPGSIESVLYRSIIKVTGKSKATERGHMTLIDMIDEYARVALN